MEENKEKKKISISAKYIIIGIVIALLGAIIGAYLYNIYYTEKLYEKNFNDAIYDYNEYFEKNINVNDGSNIHSMTGDWDKKEVKVIIKKTVIDYEQDRKDDTADLLLKSTGTEYCYKLIKSVKYDFDSGGYDILNLSYSITIVDKNEKEILTYKY